MKKIIYFFGIATLILSICSCALNRPQYIKILGGRPMGNTSIRSYPDIQTLYESDEEIFFISTWGDCSKSENHELRWELYNKNGVKVYDTIQRGVKISPYMFYSTKISLDKSIKDSLIPGMYTVKLYLDGDLVKTKSGEYVPKSIINKNVNSAVILPFNDTSVATNMKVKQSSVIINTFSSAFYNEVRRIIPRTTPHYISEKTVGDLCGPDCFEDKNCLNKIDSMFKNDIVISGNIRLSKFVVEIATLTVYVYNSKTGRAKFSYSQNPGGDLTYSKMMHDLIKGVMHEKGFLAYLTSLNKGDFTSVPKKTQEKAEVTPKVSLRKEPKHMSESKIKYFLARNNFFEMNLYPQGSFKNDFIDNGDGTITDRTTDLMWKREGSSRSLDFWSAKGYIKRLNKEQFAGYADWRLPTIEELVSLLENSPKNGVHIAPVFSNTQIRCWSSDQTDPQSGLEQWYDAAWIVSFKDGKLMIARWCHHLLNCGVHTLFDNNYVRAVRTAK